MAVAPLDVGDPERIGPYRIVGRLGRGGMGQVYLGVTPGGYAVAVKVVRTVLADDPEFRSRFVHEVRAARRVTGFFTAAVVDAEPQGTPPWLATRYVRGVSLETAVAEFGPWPTEPVLALGAALAEALEAIHRQKLVHRDLKPSNVLLAADGPRVIDFGISLAAESTELTESGMVVGTPGYISPEQLVGRTVGAASDVFALGAVLVHAATGRGPFGTGHAHALNYRVVHEEPDLTGLPPELADVVARCLAKDPDQRPTVPHLVAELGRGPRSGQADGSSAEAGWLPKPVTVELTRRLVEQLPVPEPESSSPVSSPGGKGRVLTRGWYLAGLAVTAILAVIAAATLLPDRGSGDDPVERAEETRAPALRQLWTYRQSPNRPPLVEDGTIYFAHGLSGAADAAVYAVDADTGDHLWEHNQTTGYVGPLAFAEGTLFFSSGEFGDPGGDRVYALDADTGSLLWELNPDGEVEVGEGPVAIGGTVYFTTFDTDFQRILYAADAATGEIVWNHSAGRMYAMAAADEVVYYSGYTTSSGNIYLYTLDAGTGEQLWRVRIGDDVDDMMHSLAFTGGVIHGVSDGALSAWDADTGDLLRTRRTDLDLQHPEPPTMSGGVVYASGVSEPNTGYGEVLAVSAETGDVLWENRMMVGEDASLTVTAEAVYVVTEFGDLYLLDTNSGETTGQVQLADGDDPRATIVNEVAYYDGGDGRLHTATINR
ncbi:PQQ-binding-like beta-propeller repeat protein [Streptomyces sp. NPDC127098]|uniref:protein kinase domain-containing protein n=1 Tax=Streptomyces sp. NPDC127098 TaxID=3347137 RepID=UPI0036648999